MADCFCQSGKSFEICCSPYLSGQKDAATAEILMRARYSAFATGQIDFVMETIHPRKRGDYDPNEMLQWSEQSVWKGLKIKSLERGKEKDKDGQVEFIAHYETNGQDFDHHELSTFEKQNEKWYFVDGKLIKESFKREAPKIGRNDPCSCGSGKKFKKCCGV